MLRYLHQQTLLLFGTVRLGNLPWYSSNAGRSLSSPKPYTKKCLRFFLFKNLQVTFAERYKNENSLHMLLCFFNSIAH